MEWAVEATANLGLGLMLRGGDGAEPDGLPV